MQDLYFGAESWSFEAGHWLKSSPESVADCALRRIEQKDALVWLYKDDEEIIGFGSLGPSRWAVPDENGMRRPVTVIPWMAIQERFRRCLPGVPKDQRYSSLILDDLIDEACEWVEEKPYLCLFVHPDNIGAIHLYERHNFARLQKPYVDPETGVAYLRMFTRLQISDGLAVE